MDIIKITKDNINNMKSLYCTFCKGAVDDYLFEVPPIPFDDFKLNLEEGFLEGYYAQDISPEGFLLYSDKLSQAIEITLIYAKEQEENYKIKNLLLERFLKDAKEKYPDKTISYPMLGIQKEYAQDITSYGFNLVGEMILEFNFTNPISHVVLAKADVTIPNLPYNIDKWQDVYLEDAAECLCEEFSKLNDAKFDPRFLTIEGSKDIINNIIQSHYGKFLPQMTTVLRCEHKPVGYCFVNLTTDDVANIPLLFLKHEHKNKGLGGFMLKNSLILLKNAIAKDELNTKILNATCDTDNFSAIKTYRKLGFKENNYYPHAYLDLGEYNA